MSYLETLPNFLCHRGFWIIQQARKRKYLLRATFDNPIIEDEERTLFDV